MSTTPRPPAYLRRKRNRWTLFAVLFAVLFAGLGAGLGAGLDAGLDAGLIAGLFAVLFAVLGAVLGAGLFAVLGAVLGAVLFAVLIAGLSAGLSAVLIAVLGAGLGAVLSAGLFVQEWLDDADAGQRMRNVPIRLIRGLTRAAAKLAGPSHGYLQETWLADLRGIPEEGRSLSVRKQLRYARGYLRAAVRIRLADLGTRAGRRLDWALVSEKRTCTIIATVVAVMACYTFKHQGLIGLVTNAENIVVTGAGLYGAARGLRRARDVQPSQQQGPTRPVSGDADPAA
jgi:hypothetical protein